MLISVVKILIGIWWVRAFCAESQAISAACLAYVLQRQPLALEVHGAAAVGEAGVVGDVVVDASAAMRHGRAGAVHGRVRRGNGTWIVAQPWRCRLGGG